MVKQVVIVSGKGGTGKTIVSAAFAAIAKNKVLVDADVDAADLFLLLHPKTKNVSKFSGGSKAAINANFCNKCGKCKDICHFDAIKNDAAKYYVDDILCEGCRLCTRICPNNAIKMNASNSGEWYISETKYGAFVHAKLGVAEENSGKLVSLIKSEAIIIANQTNAKWIIIDGPPGIGCQTIASIGNSNCVVVVTEPTISGLYDAKRVVELIYHFKIPIKFIINKYDLNLNITKQIEDFCCINQIEIIGKIIFDKCVVQSIVDGITIMDSPQFTQKEVLLNAWEKIEQTVIKR